MAAAREDSAGDLEAGEPPTTGASNSAETGTPARIVLGARRERAAATFARFYEAIARRDVMSMTQMLDAAVYDLDGGDIVPRETVARDIDEATGRIDPVQLRAALTGVRPTVRSSGEARRLGRVQRVPMTPDDWVVDWPIRGGSIGVGVALPVRSMMVRFVGDDAVVAGVTLGRRGYR